MTKTTGGLVAKIGLFVAIFGPMTSVLGKAVGGIGDMISKIGGWIAANQAAKVSQDALNASMKATPWGAIGTAVGIGVSAITALVASTSLLSEETDGLNKQMEAQKGIIEQSNKAYQDRVGSLTNETDASLALLDRLEKLNGQETLSEEQKRELLYLVEQLNKANDGLNLSYNEQTGAIDRTVESIRDYITAKGEQLLLQAREEQAFEKAKQIAEAERLLTEALKEQAEYNPIVAAGASSLSNEHVKLAERVEKLTAELDKLKSEYDGLITGIVETGDAVRDFEQAAGEAGGTAREAALSVEELKKQGDDAAKSYENLISVLTTMAKGNDLSLTQIRNLITQYPLLANEIEKTKYGYRLNEEAVRALAAAELDSMIAVERAAYARAEAVKQEARDALDARVALMRGINAQMQAEYALLGLQTEEQKGIAKTIDMLEGLRAELEKPYRVPPSSRRAAAPPSEREAKEKTQEEIDLENYKRYLAEAQFARDMSDKDKIEASKEFYAEMGRLRDLYLREDSDEWRRAAVEIKRHQDSLVVSNEQRYKDALKQAAYARDFSLKDDKQAQIDFYADMERLRDEFLELESDAWKDATLAIMQFRKQLIADAEKDAAETAERIRKEFEDAYRAELGTMNYLRDMDVINVGQYYDNLRWLQTNYLEEGSDEWRRVNVEIYQYEKRNHAERLEAEKKFHAAKKAEQEAAAKAAYDNRVKQIRAELALEKERLNQLIKNIDDELNARKRLDEEQSFEKRIAMLNLQIEHERNAENIVELEKELLRVEKERDDYEFRRQKEDEKTALREQITTADKLAQAQIAEAERTRDELLKQYEKVYDVMMEQLGGTGGHMPLQAVPDAFAASSASLKKVASVTNELRQDNRTITAPITAITTVTPQLIAAVVRNVLEEML